MKWIISNHKNALDESTVHNYANELQNISFDNINLVICPSDDYLEYFISSNYSLGCQDINLTFEQLKTYDVKFCIVGHSYKRKIYNETDEQINKKIKDLISNEIVPILCIGEENNDDLKSTLKRQLVGGLDGVSANVIIAYEPVWAIGSGIIPDIDVLRDIITFIEYEATKILNKRPIILYGGSVNNKTISLLENVREIDGYLIGGASIDLKELKELIEVIK